MIIEFWAHAKSYYVTPAGKPTGEAENFRVVLGPLRRLYGASLAAEFGPRCLRALQQEMIRMGWCRNVVNRQTGRIKHAFKWAVSAGLVPPTVYHGLVTVGGLRAGKTEARETAPVKPIPEEWVEAVLPYLRRFVNRMQRCAAYSWSNKQGRIEASSSPPAVSTQ